MATSLDTAPGAVIAVDRAPVERPGAPGGTYGELSPRPAYEPGPPVEVGGVSPGVKALYTFLGLVLAAYAISVIARRTGDSVPLVDGWGVASFEMLAGVLVLTRGLTNQRDRAFGLWLGVGMCSWASGDFAMTIETMHGATPATLSTANVLWFGFFPLAYAGAMVLMRRDVRRFTVANYLDGLIACLVTGALFTAFAFRAIAGANGAGTEFTAVNVIYPLGDLLLLFLVAIPIRLLPPGKRTRWYLIAAACVSNASGDIVALFPRLTASHAGYLLNSVAWPVSLFLISSAVWLAHSTTDAPQQDTTNGFSVPAVAGGLALVVLFVDSFRHLDQAAIGFASATMLAAGVRFGIALRRLRALTEERHQELRERQQQLSAAAAAEQSSREALQATVGELSERQQQLSEAASADLASREALQATVREYSDFASRVADGDLTATLPAGGNEKLEELAESLNRMVLGLAEISREIKSGVVDMSSSTADILAAVRDHTRSAGQQSAAIEQASTTVDELGAAAGIISTKASEVARRARESLQVSDEGSSAVAAIAEAMQDIRTRVDGIARDIEILSERTKQIGEITETVNGLADHSKLLALNASIEAARAGEHGRGFAVVAEEVRRLAEQSKSATAQVETILGDIQAATEAAVRASEQGKEVVAHGLALADRAGEGIRSLSETIRAASVSAEDIAASVQEQSASVSQIASAMNEINAGTGHFVEGARQSQSAAENLDELSGKLAAIAGRYRV
ncbi:MAG TPA: methyl-accepting chemotaxis protein [Acidimicrobiales bacterium]|nr:methyl-accepting chemotaxis protein [Acidimicrobiales bacterium]